MFYYLRSAATHPLTRRNPISALWRIARHQLLIRTRREVVLPWVGGSRLAMRRNMPGASGNIYYGLHEYTEMGLLLHVLRPGDLFADVGANVGSWTVLASAVCGARSVAFEPDPGTAELLRRNVEVNGVGERVRIESVALGRADGTARFSTGLDTNNRFLGAEAPDEGGRTVEVKPLDAVLDQAPTFIKIDVEGFEEDVLAGADRTLGDLTLLVVAIEVNQPPMMDLFSAAGFQRIWYDPATRQVSLVPNGILANNALFVRDVDAVRERVASAPPRRVLGCFL